MKKKLRLLTIASIATKEKTIKYDHMQKVLGIDSIRELEDLIIEGTNNAVLKGKLDQKSKHFEVDYAMGRDIRKVSLSKKKIHPGSAEHILNWSSPNFLGGPKQAEKCRISWESCC